MNYRMSPNIAVPTGVADAAEAFYSGVLGCPVRTRSGDTVDIAADPPSIFITADEEIVGLTPGRWFANDCCPAPC